MANAITSCDLGQLYQAITTSISAAFPDLQTVEFDRLEREELPIPACLLEMTEADRDRNPGTGQQAYDVRFSACFIIGFRTPAAKLEIRKLALAFGAFIESNSRWPNVGGQAGAPEMIGCYPDDFDPRLDQYEVWRAEWHQCLWFGDSVWANNGAVAPSRVFIGVDPDIGAANKEKYVEITKNG